MADTCATCKYFLVDEGNANKGRCRESPPSVFLTSRVAAQEWNTIHAPATFVADTRWPEVLVGEWCGHFAAA